MLFDIIATASLVSVLIYLDRILNIFPSLLACISRWKENINLEASVKLGRDRDLAAALMFIPFCLIVTRFRLYDPSFLSGTDEGERLGMTSAVILAYFLLRIAVSRMPGKGKMNPRTYQAACKAFYSYFTILTICLTATAGIMSFAGAPQETAKSTMLWISASVYLLFLIRKTQIFMSSCSLFTAFSYLCALEIIPTGALTVSAFVF